MVALTGYAQIINCSTAFQKAEPMLRCGSITGVAQQLELLHN